MEVRVLIVDDKVSFRRAALAVVEAVRGFIVVGEAESGEDAEILARTLMPDLVLMDLRLPGITGPEATRRLLTSGARHPVVFLLSTHEPEDYAALLAECGASAFLPKWEFGPETLKTAWEAATGVPL